MELEEQISNYREIAKKIKELEEQKKALGSLILSQMQTQTFSTEDYVVRRYKKLSIKISLKEARLLDAVKMEEVVDKERIQALHELGNTLPGVSEIEWVQVSDKKLTST